MQSCVQIFASQIIKPLLLKPNVSALAFQAPMLFTAQALCRFPSAWVLKSDRPGCQFQIAYSPGDSAVCTGRFCCLMFSAAKRRLWFPPREEAVNPKGKHVFKSRALQRQNMEKSHFPESSSPGIPSACCQPFYLVSHLIFFIIYF